MLQCLIIFHVIHHINAKVLNTQVFYNNRIIVCFKLKSYIYNYTQVKIHKDLMALLPLIYIVEKE